MTAPSPGTLLPPLPPASLDRQDIDASHRSGIATTTVPLGSLLAGDVAAVLTSACRVPRESRGPLIERALGIGDRRDVLLGADRPLARLAPGTEVVSPDPRSTALLRAHHGTLVPRLPDPGATGEGREPGAGGAGPEIRALWLDPGVESAGELLEPESWLPAPGQGVAVLLHAPEATARFSGLPTDPGAEAILRAERAVGDAFAFAVPLVQAQLFGEWLSIHAVILTPGGDRAVRARVRGDRGDPAGVAERLVEVLVERGGLLLRSPEEGRQRSSGAPAR